MPRAALLAAIVALGCAHAPAEAPPAPAPKVTFVPYPAAQVAGVKDPHAYKGKALCQRCHVQGGGLLKETNALCKECHAFSGHNHPVDVVQQTAVDLPVAAGGRLTCFTCHDPHQKKRKLRKPFNDLCVSCHAK